MAKTTVEILQAVQKATQEFEAGMAQIEMERKALLNETVREMEAKLIEKLKNDIQAKFK